MESKDTISFENQKEVLEQSHESKQESAGRKVDTSNSPTGKDWFEPVCSFSLGLFCALAMVVGGLFFLKGICGYISIGYDRWFCTEGFIEVGERGYCYDPRNKCLVKPIPNRRVIKGCIDIDYRAGDTIGVVQFGENEYRYVNFNTLSFINENKYFRADVFRNGTAMALANDTVYHISPTGKTITAEPSNWVYGSVEEITFSHEESDSDGYSYTKEERTGILKYEDVYGNFGLMTNEFVPLTNPIFSSITAISKDVIFCEYLETALGVLIDKEGHIIK